MINWSFLKLSQISHYLSQINSSGILGIYKLLILFGVILSVCFTLPMSIFLSPILLILLFPFYILNFSLKFFYKKFPKESIFKQDYNCKLLNLGDTKALEACQELLNICQIDGQLKLGLFKESPCHYKILCLENSAGDLIGFVEFFSKTGEEEHICIEKLIMNSKYEGLGFTRLLVESLQELKYVSSIEVWALWRSESFYKKLGFVDVVALSTIESKNMEDLVEDSRNLKRVFGDFGPLLIWNRD